MKKWAISAILSVIFRISSIVSMSNRRALVMTLEDYEKLKEKYTKITNRAEIFIDDLK